MNITKRLIIACLFLSTLFSANLFSAQSLSYVVDTPNTELLDYGSYGLNFRLFKDGGVLTRLDFGVFRVVNLGFGWEVSKVVGDQDVSVGPPSLFLKIKPFEGGMILPELAFGYDGQGYFYDKNTEQFLLKEKGIYVVLGKETMLPGLKMTAGANISDFKTNTVFAFVTATLSVEEKIFILAEYDNINCMPKNRINAGLRFFITESLGVDLSVRDLGAAGRAAERIIRVNYIGRF